MNFTNKFQREYDGPSSSGGGYNHYRRKLAITSTVLGVIVITGLFVLGLWGCPQYNVYSMRKDGEAQLAHAKYSREVAVAEAKAKYEAASLLAAADTLRAHGIAKSNEIIGRSLENNPKYLQWLFIDKISEGKENQIIYLPTEAGIPILEANRFKINQQIKTPPNE